VDEFAGPLKAVLPCERPQVRRSCRLAQNFQTHNEPFGCAQVHADVLHADVQVRWLSMM
jgi:hypothetical protein